MYNVKFYDSWLGCSYNVRYYCTIHGTRHGSSCVVREWSKPTLRNECFFYFKKFSRFFLSVNFLFGFVRWTALSAGQLFEVLAWHILSLDFDQQHRQHELTRHQFVVWFLWQRSRHWADKWRPRCWSWRTTSCLVTSSFSAYIVR